jgi:cell division protein FtsN
MLAGRPAMLNVTALRREEVAEDPAIPPAPDAAMAEPDTLADTAAAALAAADARATAAPPAASAAPAPAPASTGGAIPRPFIQIGIFSQEANADRAAAQMRGAGLDANILREESQGQTFWRVTVGPSTTTVERDRALAQVRGLGFADAYAVSR